MRPPDDASPPLPAVILILPPVETAEFPALTEIPLFASVPSPTINETLPPVSPLPDCNLTFAAPATDVPVRIPTLPVL